MTAARMQFELALTDAPRTRRRADTAALRILVLGDFSGGAAVPLGERRTLGVDIDSLGPVFARLGPRLTLDLDGSPLALEFRSLDDFHPDHLFERLAPVRPLRQLRAELLDPAQFQRAAAALGVAPAPDAATPGAGGADSAADIERLLGRAPSPPATPSGPAARDLDAWLRTLVAPHVVPDIGREQRALVAAVDAAIAEQLRRVLHSPAFQALEGRWRGVERLVRELDLGETLHLSLLDATREDLVEDLRLHADDLTRSALHDHLSGPRTATPDGEGWSLLVSDLSFGPDLEDLELLAGLGALAGRAGAPLLAAASPALLGCASPAQLPDPHAWQPLPEASAAFWQALRTSPIAPWIGLALPRILARLPYGRGSDPIAAFDFEELVSREHAGYLWSSPALALALLAGQAFAADGWDLDLRTGRDLTDLPSHVYREDGTPCQQPCAEVAMGEAAGTAALRLGLMPFLSYRNRNAARLLGIQSIADPAGALAGAWTGG